MKHLPHSILAIDGCMEIHFRNVRGSSSSSFTASYETFSKTEAVPLSYYSGCLRYLFELVIQFFKHKYVITIIKRNFKLLFIWRSMMSFCSVCSSTYIRSQVGVISSQKWPLSLSVFPKCEWDIDAGASNKVIKLNFMDMNIGTMCLLSYVTVEGNFLQFYVVRIEYVLSGNQKSSCGLSLLPI